MIVRRGERTYLYRSVRIDGRPTREYVCSDPTGLGLVEALQASHDELRARRRRAAMVRREAIRAEAAKLIARDREVGQAVAEAVEAARSCLESLGYHRVSRSRWRKRRRGRHAMTTTLVPASAAGPLALARPITPADLAYLERLPGKALDEVFTDAAGTSQAERQIATQDIARHASDLAGPHPTAIERNLAITAAIVWAELRMTEGVEIRLWTGEKGPDNRSAESKDLCRKHVDRLRRRYASLLKTLADVRRLAGPALVVNVAAPGAAQQVNFGPPPMAGPAPIEGL